ncbi:GIY-YIG nuclease family protein [Lysobacter sp. 22409]|uniref:GIY-YIG nuclease family protein n=1 Tax=Lysobacter sp. 22409 TaxID=3453917 RepID=UPI003F83D73B
MVWHIYLLECLDGSTYTGIASDVDARYLQHVRGQAAQHTRVHPPRTLVSAVPVGSRAQAGHLEKRIKRWPKARKIAFFQPYTADWRSYCPNPSAQERGQGMPELLAVLEQHAEAIHALAVTEAEVWTALKQRTPALAQTLLQSGMKEADAARWMCFPIESLAGSPAQLIARGEANQVLAYVLQVTQRL